MELPKSWKTKGLLHVHPCSGFVKETFKNLFVQNECDPYGLYIEGTIFAIHTQELD